MKSGGPAFPLHVPTAMAGDASETHAGMTLRDYFAGQALAGICGDGIPGSHHQPEQAAADAYRLADAMLKQREKT